MRLRLLFLALAATAGTVIACVPITDPTSSKPTTPASFMGRPIDVQDNVTVKSNLVTLRVWDSGTIDGDIISLVVNGQTVLAQYTLTGSKRAVSVALSNGYNWVMIYAHNEGSIPPNTAALSIDDGTGERNVVLSANLSTNAAVNVLVQH